MFYTYRQCSNNGSYVLNNNIKHYVSIQAESEQQAYKFLTSLSDKAIWGKVFIDEDPVVEYSKGILSLVEFIRSKHNKGRKSAIIYDANGTERILIP